MNDPYTIIVLLILGSYLLYAFFKWKEKKGRIIKNGIEVKGVVFEYDDIEFLDKESYPLIRFVTREGVWVTEKPDYYPTRNLLKEGQEVTVIYNPKNPKEFIYRTSFDYSLIYYLALVAAIVCLSVGLWLAYQYLTSQQS